LRIPFGCKIKRKEDPPLVRVPTRLGYYLGTFNKI
jgi:hypothetical protein